MANRKWQIESGRVSGIWCRKFYDPNDLEKQNQAFEQNGSRLMKFRKTEQSDVDEALLKWLSQSEVTMYRWDVLFLWYILFFPDINFKLTYWFSVNPYGNSQL